MVSIKRPAARYHGGKWRIAKWIISFFPSHQAYLEPFGGLASVLLQKKESQLEIYNDIDQQVFNFFQVLRDPCLLERLLQQMEFTPYHRIELQCAMTSPSDDPVERARQFLIKSTMGFSSDSATRKSTTGFRSHADAVKTYHRGFDHLRDISTRLRSVLFECKPAIDLISLYDNADTLVYADPPFLLSSRNNAWGGYRHEMTDSDHESLWHVLGKYKGMVVLSGYPSELYDDMSNQYGFKSFSCNVIAQSNKGNISRREMVWLNPAAFSRLNRPIDPSLLSLDLSD